MSELWSYTLDDFLLFSPRVYFRMMELHNQAYWPAQIVAIILGIVILVMVTRPNDYRNRRIFAIFGAVWIWIAWSFFWQRYGQINWVAVYAAPIAALQGLLLVWFGVVRKSIKILPCTSFLSTLSLGLMALSVVAYPLIAFSVGRSYQSGEFFGFMPDPTAIATLGLLAVSTGKLRWMLMIIPLMWCVITGVTLWGINAPEWYVAPIAALLTLLCARHWRSD